MTPARRLRPFTPNAESFERLDARTVGRESALRVLADRLDAAATSANRPHTLIVGPRGSGKSHLVEVALGRATRTEVADRLVVVPIDEDAVGITRVDDLYVAVLRALDVDVPSPDRRTQAVTTALAGRVLVLVLHNLDRIFQALGVSGQQDFRAWVENSGDIMVLGTSPALFPGIREHSKPWYNGFGIVHLDELTVAQGRELLTHLAREYDDEALAEFLNTNDGEARLKAVHALAGGSPRIWMILSECLTVEVLDDLVAAVEGLLEGLVPYYQQLLWELSPNEQRIVRALAEGPTAAKTVAELAAHTDIEQRSLATTLGRLTKDRWVVAEKPSGTDRRTTWYRLAEPLLRHHFQYRSAGRRPIVLIVELLRALFDTQRTERELIMAASDSRAERLLVQSLEGDPRSFDRAWDHKNIASLMVEARRWLNGADAERRTRGAGIAIESAIIVALGGVETVHRPIDASQTFATNELVEGLIATLTQLPESTPEVKRIGAMLDEAVRLTRDRDRVVCELVAIGWSESDDWAATVLRLDTLLASADMDHGDPLWLDISMERSQCAWLVDNEREGQMERLTELLHFVRMHRGPDHPDTLRVMHWTAMELLNTDRFAAARELYADIEATYTRAYGAQDILALMARYGLAESTGWSGNIDAALRLSRQLVEDYESMPAGSADDVMCGHARVQLARWTGKAGDQVGACKQALTILADSRFEEVHEAARLTLSFQLRGALNNSELESGESRSLDRDELIEQLVEAVRGDSDARARLPVEIARALTPEPVP